MTLKEKLPQWETDYLMPAWLILAILAAAVAETVVVGYGVQKLYGLWLGWPVGFVIASTQALGSQMYSYNATHNSRRYIKWRTRQGQRYFNEWEAEPALNIWLPLAVSIGAGVVAGSVGVALYRSISDTLSVALVALSVASPAGSIAAALLNGLFASGELALRQWQEQAEQDEKPAVKPQEPAEPEKSEKVEPAEPAPVTFECEQCNRSFGTVQARNAHQRFCAGKASNPNGKEPAREQEEQEA
jgi:hypothetical protein